LGLWGGVGGEKDRSKRRLLVRYTILKPELGLTLRRKKGPSIRRGHIAST